MVYMVVKKLPFLCAITLTILMGHTTYNALMVNRMVIHQPVPYKLNSNLTLCNYFVLQ